MHEILATQLGQVVRLCAWLAILSLLFVPLERLFALRPSRIWRKEVWTDLGYYFLNSLVPNLLLVPPMAVVAMLVHRAMPAGALAFAATLPLWARVVAIMVVGEVGFYWGHRWSHEIPFLWRFHAVHHSAEHMDFLVNTRAHPMDMVFTRLCGFVPLYALGLSNAGPGHADLGPLLLVFVGTMWGFFVHSNLRWRFGPLEWLVATPAFHHWHHTNDASRDRNYAAMLPWVDRLFGTHHLPRSWPPEYGIDAAMPPGLPRQLLAPLARLPERHPPSDTHRRSQVDLAETSAAR